MAQDLFIGGLSWLILLGQTPAFFILLSRLLKGARRQTPLLPQVSKPEYLGQVTVVVPTLNEVERISPCLQGLSQQGYEVREFLIVDSNSQDGTREKVEEVARKDPRFRLHSDAPLPQGWVGRPWALHNGYLLSAPASTWILGIDADTQPQRGLIPSLIETAIAGGYDLLSLSPQFILRYPGEWWLQPALLMTLLYRFESAGVNSAFPERVMANGQCLLSKREVLEALGGYSSAASSFCDDVTLARRAASLGYRVGFLDGAKVLRVRMYEGFGETWREWGRSLDLKDASARGQVWGDLGFLILVQGLPLLLLLVFGALLWGGYDFLTLRVALGLNLVLVLIRFALLGAIVPSYCWDRRELGSSWLFWLSPCADPLAVLRIFLSTVQKPKFWRGRIYSTENK